MRHRLALRRVRASLPAVLAVSTATVFSGCGPSSRTERTQGEAAGDAGSANGGRGSQSGGTASGAIPTAGSSTAAGGSTRTGVPGGGGTSDTGGNAGTSDEGGVGGDAGEGPACPSNGTSCPSGCFELPVVTGCGDDAERSVICTATALTGSSLSCGVRLEDGRTFHRDGPPSPLPGPGVCTPNPFATLDGFRACTADEALSANCDRVETEPSVATVRFEVANRRTTPISVLNAGMNCAPLRLTELANMQQVAFRFYEYPCACIPVSGDPFFGSTTTTLEPSGSLAIEWDGREDKAFRKAIPCTSSCDAPCNGIAKVPAPAGRYRVEIGVATDPAPLNNSGYVATSGLCLRPEAPVVSVEFDLPASGNVVVQVPVD